ncbi:hypothetical protein [Blastomonas sp.]|uniref:hypothetical protein n=1 Tax=Blastomonas sp. TaxID=1909299 RepID=UPI003593D0D9
MAFGKKGVPTDINDVAAMPASSSADDPQRDPRMNRLMKVTVFHERFGSSDAVIRNISRGGLGGRCFAELRVGDVIDIAREGFGRFEAEIRWVRNGHFGAALTSDMTIDTDAVENLSFDKGDWDGEVNKPLKNHVFTRFRPVRETYRPGVNSLRRP